MNMKQYLDPFGISTVTDYAPLFTEFGFKKINPKNFKNPSMQIKRGIEFAHIDLDKFIKAHQNGEPIAVMSGIKPTGNFHFGSKMVAEKIIYYQKTFNAKVFYAIADIEAYEDNGMDFDETHEIAIQNIADLLALGLDPKNAYIYKQSQEQRVNNYAFLFARKVTNNTLKAVYGNRHIGLYMSALVQAGDIILPQHKDFGGHKIVLVPVGVDQAPHLRLTRDIAKKFGYIPPASTYTKFFRALDGSAKMSKRNPMTFLTLRDKPELAAKKIKRALTGGRDTVEEQKQKGGQPDKCIVYELAYYHFMPDDKDIVKLFDECTSGKLACGECKHRVIEIVKKYLTEHQKKAEQMLPKAREILKK